MRALLTTILTLVLAPLALADDAAMAEGRERSRALLAGDLAPLWADMTPELRALFGSMAGFEAFQAELAATLGEETAVLSEAVQPGDGVDTYRRTATWSLSAAPVLMQWGLAEGGDIASLLVQPAPVLAESRFLDYRTRATLQLPFEGEWFVVWGGRTLEQNYHAANPAQRFAIDALIYRDGATHAGDAAVLANYYCWDQPILAPAAGTVAAVVNDLPDNPIGTTDPDHPAGNHVVIDFGAGEFGFLAHLQQGSIELAPGDAVVAGQQLGLCGNSGNPSEPHLHFHLQNTADLSHGEGLPARFAHYRADGRPVTEGEPLAGQYIAPR